MHVEPTTCPICQKGFDPLRSRALTVTAGRVRAFCSEECRAAAERGDSGAGAGEMLDALAASAKPRRRGQPWLLGIVGVVLCAGAFGAFALHRSRVRVVEVPQAAPVVAAVATPSFSVTDALKILAAKAEPSAEQPNGLPERDLWLHPLAGPLRRLPIRATRKFRAARDHSSPDECGSGHCGVDLGESEGEWVFAAHDGVVERVVHEDVGNGGRYVRLNHRGGTLTTSYMHLGTIRPELKPGVPVHAGDPLGTIGMSGINHSGPHMHFQIGVRARPDELETFIDPEPLLHLWQLRPPMGEAPPRRLARRPRVTDPGPQGM